MHLKSEEKSTKLVENSLYHHIITQNVPEINYSKRQRQGDCIKMH